MKQIMQLTVLIAVMSLTGCATSLKQQAPLIVFSANEMSIWGASREKVFTALVDFISSKKDQPDLSFVDVEMNEEYKTVLFTSVTDGWKRLKSDNRYIFFKSDGFSTGIHVRQITSISDELAIQMTSNGSYESVVLFDHVFLANGESIPRIITCSPNKGPSIYIENRYYQIGKNTICVRLTILPENSVRKYTDVIEQLRNHLSQYEGVCRKVEGLMRGPEYQL